MARLRHRLREYKTVDEAIEAATNYVRELQVINSNSKKQTSALLLSETSWNDFFDKLFVRNKLRWSQNFRIKLTNMLAYQISRDKVTSRELESKLQPLMKA